MTRRKKLPSDAMTSLTSSRAGCVGCRRLNWSSCSTRAAARSAARWICSRSAAHRRALVDLVDHEGRVSRDGREQVVEVVRDATGELPDRLHLLRLAELFLELPSLRDVADIEHDGSDALIVEQVGEHRLAVPPLPVAVTDPEGALHRLARPVEGFEEGEEDRFEVVGVDGVDEAAVRHPRALEVPAQIALDGRARVQDGALGIEELDQLAGLEHERPESCLAVADGLLGADRVGDVLDRPADVQDPTVRAALDLDVGHDDPLFAVRPDRAPRSVVGLVPGRGATPRPRSRPRPGARPPDGTSPAWPARIRVRTRGCGRARRTRSPRPCRARTTSSRCAPSPGPTPASERSSAGSRRRGPGRARAGTPRRARAAPGGRPRGPARGRPRTRRPSPSRGAGRRCEAGR